MPELTTAQLAEKVLDLLDEHQTAYELGHEAHRGMWMEGRHINWSLLII